MQSTKAQKIENYFVFKEIGGTQKKKVLIQFFLKVISTKKIYLPNNFIVKNKLKCFRKGEKFDKKYIEQKMQGNEESIKDTKIFMLSIKPKYKEESIINGEIIMYI